MSYALALKLTDAGFLTVTAMNGEEAISKIGGTIFDLILLDLIMPRKDGFTVLAELQQKKNIPPILVLTNLGQEEDADRVRKLGARQYIIKSETPLVEVIAHVRAFLA